jgi:hypothetical protein
MLAINARSKLFDVVFLIFLAWCNSLDNLRSYAQREWEGVLRILRTITTDQIVLTIFIATSVTLIVRVMPYLYDRLQLHWSISKIEEDGEVWVKGVACRTAGRVSGPGQSRLYYQVVIGGRTYNVYDDDSNVVESRVEEAMVLGSRMEPSKIPPFQAQVLCGDSHVGWCSRIKFKGSTYLLTATHVLKEAIHDLYLGRDGRKIPISKHYKVNFKSDRIDVSLLRVDENVWSALGVKSVSVGQAYSRSGVNIYGYDHAKVPVKTFAPRLSKGDGPFEVLHEASTDHGWSGAPLVSAGMVIGVHTHHSPVGKKNGASVIPFFAKTLETDPRIEALYKIGSYEDAYEYEEAGLRFGDSDYRWEEFDTEGMSWADIMDENDRRMNLRRSNEERDMESLSAEVDTKSKCFCVSTCCKSKTETQDFRQSPSMKEGETQTSEPSVTSEEDPKSQGQNLSRNAKRRLRAAQRRSAQSSATTRGQHAEERQSVSASSSSQRR